MPGAKSIRRRVPPSRPPHRLLQALLGVMVVGLAFSTLMVRLAVMREGYRLSALRKEQSTLAASNRTLRVEVAELSSPQKLRELARKFGLGPPARGQVVVVP